ncbi:MAG TPA: hypothetical protein VGP82_21730 [Ktedonobacterales bacterium]|nr:hypothetical protein [Ktedonobacterales bacterium]
MIASNACARTPSCGSEAEAIWSQTPSEGQITIERIARATFEDMTTEEITAWLDRHLH